MTSLLVCITGQRLLSAGNESYEATRRHHEEVVLGYLRDLAWSSRKAIRIYYSADCQPEKASNVDYSVPFPFFRVQPPSRGKTGLLGVREIFKNAKDVTITEKPKGIIRIWIGKVPTEILRTRIAVLTLNKEAQFDPDLAIGAIESTKEMGAAMTSLRVISSPDGGGLVAPAEKGLPCLPASLKNVTVDQALDMIAKTWGGPVIYGVCSTRTGEDGSKLFTLGYGGSVMGKSF